MAGDEQQVILTLDEVAELLRVHPTSIYRLLQSGEFPGFKLGGGWRFYRDTIETWIQDMEAREALPLKVAKRVNVK